MVSKMLFELESFHLAPINSFWSSIFGNIYNSILKTTLRIFSTSNPYLKKQKAVAICQIPVRIVLCQDTLHQGEWRIYCMGR
jgi:hypothetical protein